MTATLLPDYLRGARFAFSWFTGSPQAPTDVPAGYMVALNGHAYNVYMAQEGLFDHETVPHQRPYNYSSAELGERSLNPDAAWRVTQQTWVKGAGQRYLDSDDSDPARYWQSKGIDPWTASQFTLLPDTSNVRASGEAALPLVSCGDYLYVGDGTEVYHTTDAVTWTSAGLTLTHAAVSLATDGYNVWAACGADGIQGTTRGATTGAQTNLLQAALVAWAKGRLMAAEGNALYLVDPSAGTAAPTALFTHPNTDWQWTAICAGDAAIYAVGYSGDYSAVYRFAEATDGSGLGAGILAGELNRGELGLALGAYDGFVLIGTSLGVRTCQASTAGDLQIGALVPTGGTRCVIGYDRFVWFGWDHFDSASAGLGRLDLSVFNEAPAYASDLMGSDGLVTAVANFGDRRAFSVSTVGVFLEALTPVSTGYLDSGRISYQVTDPKNFLAVQTRQQAPLGGAIHQVSLSVDDGAFALLGKASQNGTLHAQEARGELLEVRHTLAPNGLTAPVVRRYTVLALACPTSAKKIVVPLELDESLLKDNGQTVGLAVNAEREFLEGLRRSREVFIYQEGSVSYTVTMMDFKFIPDVFLEDRSGFGGIFLATLLTVDA